MANYGWRVNFLIIVLTALILCWEDSLQAGVVLSNLSPNLVCHFDFEHPVSGNPTKEDDLGISGTDINLINGGVAMRVNDGAYPGSVYSLQTQQNNPAVSGNDDWKAGIYQTNGVATLSAFSAVSGITLMGWVKPTGSNPNLNSGTVATNDYYNAVGLFGLLAGNSEGHGVRALLEVINVSGVLRLVALGRRIDGGNSFTLAATNDWQLILPSNVWTHLTATFDFDNGTMALYRNGSPLGATYTTSGDAWGVIGGVEPDVCSSTSPAGIKIGGSYPQNTQEFNAFNGRFDELMFFNRVVSAQDVQSQFAKFFEPLPSLGVSTVGNQIVLSWSVNYADYNLESRSDFQTGDWVTGGGVMTTNGGMLSVSLPMVEGQRYFRLRRF